MVTAVFEIENLIALVLVTVACLLVFVKGRPELAAGAFCALNWSAWIIVGPTNMQWLLAGTMLLALMVFLLRYGPETASFFHRTKSVGIWLSMWLVWILVEWRAMPSERAHTLVLIFLIYAVLPFMVLAFSVYDLTRLRAFAYAFCLVALGGGIWVMIQTPDLLYLMTSETLLAPHLIYRLSPNGNPLSFAVSYGIAFLFLFAILQESRRLMVRVACLAGLMLCVAIILMAQARQSFVGLSVAGSLFVLWAMRRREASLFRTILVVIPILAIAWSLINYTNASYAFERLRLGEWETLGVRTISWQSALDLSLSSPLFGSGLGYTVVYATAHNLFLDTAAGQGVVGLGLLVGFLVATMRFAWKSWSDTGGSEMAIWRMGLLCGMLFGLVQSQFSGGISGSYHIVWISALIWRMGLPAARDADGYRSPETPFVNSASLALTDR